MATCASNDFCYICKWSLAIKWCTECDEKLCVDCSTHHSQSKVSRGHAVIDIEQFRKLPQFIKEIKNICDQHEMKYTNLCQQHDKLCCPACTWGFGPHSKCTTLRLQEVDKTASKQTLLKSVEDSLRFLKTDLETIINDRLTNLQQLHDQRQAIETEIKQFKEKIINRLNVIEKEAIDELNSKVNQNTKQLESEIASLELKVRKAEQILEITNSLAHPRPDLRTYIGIKTMETEIAKETSLLQELVKSCTLKQVGVKFEINKDDVDVIENMSSMGTISVQVLPFSVVLVSEKEKEAQMWSRSTIKSIEGIKVTLKSRFKITDQAASIVGCSDFPSGEMIFVNNRLSNVILMKENGEKQRDIPIMSSTWDVTVIDDKTIAVATDVGVKMINITTGAVVKTIPTGMCYGLDYSKGVFICGVLGKGVLRVDLSSSIITTLVPHMCMTRCYCTVYEEKIYVSRASFCTITCYSMKGDELWKFHDTSVIDWPLGIAVDNSSNVFVASYDNNQVVILSSDGKKSRTLLTETDGMYKPYALHLNRSKKILTVVNIRGSVFLFDL